MIPFVRMCAGLRTLLCEAAPSAHRAVHADSRFAKKLVGDVVLREGLVYERPSAESSARLFTRTYVDVEVQAHGDCHLWRFTNGSLFSQGPPAITKASSICSPNAPDHFSG